MFRALFWKEWRQTTLIRWGGIAIGAMLPLAYTAGAEMGKRGLLPTGDVGRYSVSDIMFEILPKTLALGLWPIVALMVAAQVFGGDRASGTESFLLERPVPRTKLWRARLAASAATLGVVTGMTAGLGAAIAKTIGVPQSPGWTHWIEALVSGGGMTLLAFLGGLIASSLLAAQLGAVFAGAFFALLPILVGGQLAGWFPHARIDRLPIGMLLPVVMLPAYVLASWSAACRGEPAGRGRAKRGLAISGLSVVLVLLLFPVAAPVALRASAGSGMREILAGPSGRAALVASDSGLSGGSGWLVEVPSGRRRAFVPPPFDALAWSPDGTRLAVVTWSAPLGSQAREARIDILRTDDGKLERSIAVPTDGMIEGLAWVDGGIVALTSRMGADRRQRRFELRVTEPATGTWSPIETPSLPAGSWVNLLSRPGGLYLRLPQRTEAGDYLGYMLRPIDVRARRVGELLADREGRPIHFSGWTAGLSPSGRFATIVVPGRPRGVVQVVDTATGEPLAPGPVPNSTQWIRGDRLVWVEHDPDRARLLVATPGAAAVALREWSHARVTIAPSPSEEALLVSVRVPLPSEPLLQNDDASPSAPGPSGSVPEEGVLWLDERRWAGIPRIPGTGKTFARWAGPGVLARVMPGEVRFEGAPR
jgi:hypothetical protein